MPEPASLASWDDLALIYAVQGQDERALAVLYDRHGATILGYIMRVIPDQGDAESVLLATFTQVWQNAASYSPERGPVVAWLVMIARSRALDAARSAVRRARIIPLSMDDAPISSLTAQDDSSDPTHHVESAERRERVRRALSELPDAQRAAIELAFYDGLSHADVAERLGEPLGTIKTRIRLGMTKLRAALHSELGEVLS